MTDVLPAQITDAVSANQWTEYVRAKITPDTVDSEIRGPDWIIHALDDVGAAAGRMVLVVKEADRVRGEASRALVKAQARAQLQVKDEQLRVDEKAARVVEITEVESEAAAVAESAYQYARSVARLVEERKSAVQTMARMVELSYQLAGSRRTS